MQKKDADIFNGKNRWQRNSLKNQKIPGGKTANFGSRNSNQMIIILDEQPYEQQTTE